MGAIPNRVINQNIKLARVLEADYRLPIDDPQEIEELHAINTPIGQKWIVKYQHRWYLISSRTEPEFS